MNVKILEATEDPEKVLCTAARNDYMTEWAGDKSFEEVMESIGGEDIEEKKETLISHLLQHGHYGPLEHPQITFAVEGMSRSCMAQLTRHRHASFDVQSMRYVSFDDKDPQEAVCHIPELEDAGLVGRNASFATDGHENTSEEDVLEVRQEIYWEAIEESFARYQELLDWGAAPENARMVLPIGTEVNLVFSVNLRMLLHIADMRAAADAQWEIRDLTEQVLDHAEEWAPISMSYYNENMKGRKNRLAP